MQESGDMNMKIRLRSIVWKQPCWIVSFDFIGPDDDGYSPSATFSVAVPVSQTNLGKEDLLIAEARQKLHALLLEAATRTQEWANTSPEEF
jgi:hypothetical protein